MSTVDLRELRQWRTFAEVADVFGGSEDPDWAHDRDLIDQRVSDRWEE